MKAWTRCLRIDSTPVTLAWLPLACYPHLSFRRHFHVPWLMCKMGWITLIHRGGSAFRISSLKAQSSAQEAARAHTWAGTDLNGKRCHPARSRPGKVWKPTLSWSQDASLGLRQFLGQGWVPHQHQHGHRHRLAGRGICHQPPQVSVLWGGSAGRPALAGGAPPHCSGSGVAAGGLETRQTLTNSAWFPLTSLQPYLVAQPKPEAPQHLSLPAQKGRAGLSWPLKPRLGFLLQAGNRPVQGVHCLSCSCPLAGPRQCLDTGAHYRSPQRSRKDRTCRFCAVVVI